MDNVYSTLEFFSISLWPFSSHNSNSLYARSDNKHALTLDIYMLQPIGKSDEAVSLNSVSHYLINSVYSETEVNPNHNYGQIGWLERKKVHYQSSKTKRFFIRGFFN